MKVKSESEVAQSCPTLSDPMDCSPPGSSIHRNFPGKSTGVGYPKLDVIEQYLLNKIHKKMIKYRKNRAERTSINYKENYTNRSKKKKPFIIWLIL